MTRASRKVLAVLGWKGRPGYVRVVEGAVRGEPRIIVEWRDEHGKRQQQSFPKGRSGVADARGFADTLHAELTAPAPAAVVVTPQPDRPQTIRALFDLYLVAHPVPAVWRPKTLKGITERWQRFELHADRDTHPAKITRETFDAFVGKLVAAKRSINQVKHYVAAARRVFAWGVERDLIDPTKVTSYRPKFGTDAKRQKETMTEFSAEHRGKLLAVLDPKDAAEWRPWAFVNLTGYAGPRANAALLLAWPDVDLEGARVRWAPESDKMGTERWQPVPKAVVDALWVCYGWRLALGYTGPHVFFRPALATRRRDREGGRWYTTSRRVERAHDLLDKPWTYSAAIAALHRAEEKAGLTPIKWRGFHGFRRGIAGDVYDATGSEKAAAEYIGDRSVKIVRDRYLLEREERLRKVADTIGGSNE